MCSALEVLAPHDTIMRAVLALRLTPQWCASSDMLTMFLPLEEALHLGRYLMYSQSIEVSLSLAPEDIIYVVYPSCWSVRDVMLRLSVDHPQVQDCPLPVDSQTGIPLDLDKSVSSCPTSWTLSSTSKHSVCMLRGFPYKFDESNVLDFMWANGMEPHEVTHIYLQRRGLQQHFTGFVFIHLRHYLNVSVCYERLHRKMAGKRYIEVLIAK